MMPLSVVSLASTYLSMRSTAETLPPPENCDVVWVAETLARRLNTLREDSNQDAGEPGLAGLYAEIGRAHV